MKARLARIFVSDNNPVPIIPSRCRSQPEWIRGQNVPPSRVGPPSRRTWARWLWWACALPPHPAETWPVGGNCRRAHLPLLDFLIVCHSLVQVQINCEIIIGLIVFKSFYRFTLSVFIAFLPVILRPIGRKGPRGSKIGIKNLKKIEWSV